jgi:single-strand DNA-binding protein
MARSLNKVMLIGNLGRDPELRATASGMQVATFTLATNRRWKDKSGEYQEETQWHNVVAWGNQAEFVSSYLKKGSKLFVEGRLTHRTWDDKEGVKHYTTEVVLENFVPLDAPPEGARTGTRREPVPPPPPPDDAGSMDGEDVPF